MKAGNAKWTWAACLVLLIATRVFAVEEGAEGGDPPFLISTTIWAIASFLVVLFILSKKLFPPILAAMDKRAQDIRDSLDSAERARAEAKEMIQRHQDDLAKAREEAAAIIEEGRSDAQKLRDTIVANARNDAEELTARARREIEQTKHNAVVDLQQMSAKLSIDITRQLIRKNLNLKDHKGLIEERIKGFPAA